MDVNIWEFFSLQFTNSYNLDLPFRQNGVVFGWLWFEIFKREILEMQTLIFRFDGILKGTT